jgi:uncharacterized membrane protein YphA (DoxX/SURF4 family)
MSRGWQLWASTLARLVLAGVLGYAGAIKIANPDQAAAAVQAYRIFPAAVGEAIGYAVPVVELALALLLLIGLFTRLAAAATAILMVAFIIGVASAWVRGLSIDCGCFGGGGEVAAGETRYLQEIIRDLLFLGLACWLVAFPRSRYAVDTHLTEGAAVERAAS